MRLKRQNKCLTSIFQINALSFTKSMVAYRSMVMKYMELSHIVIPEYWKEILCYSLSILIILEFEICEFSNSEIH